MAQALNLAPDDVAHRLANLRKRGIVELQKTVLRQQSRFTGNVCYWELRVPSELLTELFLEWEDRERQKTRASAPRTPPKPVKPRSPRSEAWSQKNQLAVAEHQAWVAELQARKRLREQLRART